MATHDSFTTSVADSDQLNDGYFNSLARRGTIVGIYTGTGFDSARTSTISGTDTDNHELTAIATADLVGSDYLIIKILATIASRAINDASCSVSVKIETKDIGGAYADSLATTNVHASSTGANYSDKYEGLRTIEWVHTLTANEKSAGVQVKVTTSSTTSNSSSSSVTEFTNVQTVLTAI